VQIHQVFCVLYTLTKIRGSKMVARLLPHQVHLLESNLVELQRCDRSQHRTWQSRYVLLLWLSVLVLAPFDLATMDSASTPNAATPSAPSTSSTLTPAQMPASHTDSTSAASDIDTHTHTDAPSLPLATRLSLTGQAFLADPGKTREAGAELLARLLTRKDTVRTHLGEFLDHANRILLDPQTNMYSRTGWLASVALVLKYGRRDELLLVLPRVAPSILTAPLMIPGLR
jgi:tubulin-specific chaperone D